VVFVPGTVPGDEVEVIIDDDEKTFMTGHIDTVFQPSPHRRQPPCLYIGRCGGCSWQQVSYEEQLRAKEAIVREQLRRIGGMSDPPLRPIIASPQEWHYRHRIRLHVEAGRRLGFQQAASHTVVEVDTCLIAEEALNRQLASARTWLAMLHTPLQEVELMSSDSTAPHVILVGKTEEAFHPIDDATNRTFLQGHQEIAGIMLRGNGWCRSWGDSTVTLELGADNHSLEVRDGSFTQVNLAANRTLIATMLELAQFQSAHRVVELYCGAGNFSLPIARRVQSLIGIEQAPGAIASARENATRHGVKNVRFLRARVHAGLSALLREGVAADVVVLDPPRRGAADIIDLLPQVRAKRIIYVSCDPPTLARDLRRLHTYGYEVLIVQPLDLFPQTYHVETIALAGLTC
jgi:23S rRNA (uracil1939-C5)-methyltransferase